MLMPFLWILVLNIVFTYYGDGSWITRWFKKYTFDDNGLLVK